MPFLQTLGDLPFVPLRARFVEPPSLQGVWQVLLRHPVPREGVRILVPLAMSQGLRVPVAIFQMRGNFRLALFLHHLQPELPGIRLRFSIGHPVIPAMLILTGNLTVITPITF